MYNFKGMIFMRGETETLQSGHRKSLQSIKGPDVQSYVFFHTNY